MIVGRWYVQLAAIWHWCLPDLGGWQVEHFHKTVGAKLGSTLHMARHHNGSVTVKLCNKSKDSSVTMKGYRSVSMDIYKQESWLV